MKKTSIYNEIKKQITNAPSFSLDIPAIEETDYLNNLCQQIEEAFKRSPQGQVFLIGPSGSGKTTLIRSYLKKHPNLNYRYKSLIRVNTLDYAFLHLADYFSRVLILTLLFVLGCLILWAAPLSASVPFIALLSYLFTKNSGNLLYIIQEALHNLCIRQPRLVIIDGLERSSLSPEDQWALLANLWEHKRSYIICMGYPTYDSEAGPRSMENVQQLGGTIIEVIPSEDQSYQLLKKIIPSFPFSTGAWMTLLNFRDILLIKERSSLLAKTGEKNPFTQVCQEILAAKINLSKIDQRKSSLTAQQKYYLKSFEKSMRSSR